MGDDDLGLGKSVQKRDEAVAGKRVEARRRFVKNLVMGTLVAASLMTTTAAMAHRVNVFAWVDGDEVHTESKFSGGTLVRSGGITVKDEKTGAVVNQGTTNDLSLIHI